MHSAPSSARSCNTLKATLMQQQLATSQRSETLDMLCLPSHVLHRNQMQNNTV